MKKSSLTEKLIIYFILLSVGAIAIVGIYSFLSDSKALKSRTYDQLSTVRYLKKKEIEQFYLDRIHDLQLVSEDLTAAGNEGTLSAASGRMLTSTGYYHRFIYYSAGRTWSVNLDSAAALFDTTPLSAHCDSILGACSVIKEAVITDLVPGDREKWVQYIILRISTGEGKNALTALELSSGAVGKLMPDANPLNGLGKSGEAYLVGRDRFLRTSSRFIDDAILRVQIDTATAALAFSGHDGTWQMNDYRGIKVLGTFSQLAYPCPDWAVIAEIDLQEAMVPVYRIRNNIIFITVFIASIVFGATWLISRRITRPLVELQKAAVQLGEGKLGTRVDITSTDEIGDLALTFNQMSRQLLENEKLIEKERARRMRAAFDGQDVERQRLSRELHDGLGQSMIAQKLRMESIRTPETESDRKALEDLKENADNLVDEVRRISNALMPAQLHQFGLVAAIRQHCEEVSRYSGLEIRFEATGNFEPMSRKVKTYLFRIVQEALNNVVKHSEATHAAVEIAHTRDHVFMSISDNGKGFDTEKAFSGNGLNNMRERASLLSGSLSTSSEPGNGTVIEIQIPCKG